jgi:ubiquinone/menaquinone biosynthesis C-methylase UbiE
MRSRILASAINSSYGRHAVFQNLLKDPDFLNINILEINEAGALHKFLAMHSRHQLVEYPLFDMMHLDLPDEEYDLIVHSDTLEHIPDPLRGMKECCRVLRQGGKCIYTIPVIIDRMTKARIGMPPSYHGNPHEKSVDYMVHTEYGCDAWRTAFEAGFKNVKIHALDFPSALAFELEK